MDLLDASFYILLKVKLLIIVLKLIKTIVEQKRVAMEARDQEPVGAQSPQKRNYSNLGRGGAGRGRGRGQTNASSGSAALTRKDWVKIEVMKGAFSSL